MTKPMLVSYLYHSERQRKSKGGKVKSPFTFLDGASEKEQELHRTQSTNTREIVGRTCLRLGDSSIK